jgi:hypothetical protein
MKAEVGGACVRSASRVPLTGVDFINRDFIHALTGGAILSDLIV